MQVLMNNPFSMSFHIRLYRTDKHSNSLTKQVIYQVKHHTSVHNEMKFNRLFVYLSNIYSTFNSFTEH